MCRAAAGRAEPPARAAATRATATGRRRVVGMARPSAGAQTAPSPAAHRSLTARRKDLEIGSRTSYNEAVTEFRLLGPLEAVADNGEPLALGGQKQRAVLALLLLRANRVV